MDYTTFTTNCGHHTPVVVSDMHNLNKLPRVDMELQYLLQYRRLQPSHVGRELKQEHLCCTDDLVSEPPSRGQDNLPITVGQTIGTVIYPQFRCLNFLLGCRGNHDAFRANGNTTITAFNQHWVTGNIVQRDLGGGCRQFSSEMGKPSASGISSLQ